MNRDYPGMSEENEIFLKEVLKPKGRMTVFYPEEVQLLLEELRGRLSPKAKFPFLAKPGIDWVEKIKEKFVIVCDLAIDNGEVKISPVEDCIMYYLDSGVKNGKQHWKLISRIPLMPYDTNPNWPFPPDAILEDWEIKIRDIYKAADPDRWPE